MREFTRRCRSPIAWLVLLVVLGTYGRGVPARADDLVVEYIGLMFQLEELYEVKGELEDMLSSHEEYLADLDEAIYQLDLELITESHTQAEQASIIHQLNHLMQDCIDMLEAIDEIEDDIATNSEAIMDAGIRMYEIEYELTNF